MSKTIFGRYRSQDGTVTRCDMTIEPPGSAPRVAGAEGQEFNSELFDRPGFDDQTRERLRRQTDEVDDDEVAPQLALL